MKEFVQCNCSLNAPFRTPWCDLLKSINGTTGEVLHFWYKLDWLRDEIAKRTAYLGKFRRTEEAPHLLDLVTMTKDEDNLFVPFAKDAMGDIAEVLAMYAPKHEQTFFWNEGKETIVFDDSSVADIEVDEDGYLLLNNVEVDADGYLLLNNVEVDADGYATIQGNNVVTFSRGDYVLFNGNLYIAIANGSSADFVGKLCPTEDYRKSIHFGIVWKCCQANSNIIDSLDTAIFEALVARIIYKWLTYAYPSEAQRYALEWEECLTKIKRRADMLNGPKIVNRIPRQF